MPNIITRGAASLKSLGFSGGQRNIAITYLVVAGGGGGGSQNNSGGGEQWYDQKIGTNNKIRAIRKVSA